MQIPKYKRILLSEAFPDWAEGDGIFVLLSSPPWDTVTPSLLDLDYFGNHSGDKLISPIVHKLLTDDGELDTTGRTALANLVMAKYYPIWEKLWATYDIEYNPLNNFSMTEEGESEESGEDSTTVEYGGVQDRTIERDTSVADSKYGFNSSDAVPTDSSAGNDDTTENTTNSGSDTTSGMDSKSSSFSRTKTGFNGIGSYQEIIKKDRELWKVDFFSIVYSDLDKLLTLPIYSATPVLNNPYWIPSYPII